MTEAGEVLRSGDPELKPYQLSTWGDVKISYRGSDCTPSSRKARALIAFLASHTDKAFRREKLAELLWSDRGDEQARASLRQTLVALKPLVESDPPLLRADRHPLQLHPGSAFATQFDVLSAIATRNPDAFDRGLPDSMDRAFADLDEISDSFDDWLVGERSRRTDELSGLVQRAIAAANRDGQQSRTRKLEAWLRRFDPAWAGELPDAEASVATATTEPMPRPSAQPSKPIAITLLAAIAIVVAAGLFVFGHRTKSMPSIAVLPFETIPATANTNLADGISEEIMTRLAADPNQRRGELPPGRSAAGRPGHRPAPWRGLPRRRQSSIRQDIQMRVDVSLLSVRDGTRLWTERFVGGPNDVFAIQDRIGRAISSRIGTRQEPSLSPPVSGAAHLLVLTARGLVHARTPDTFDAAVILLRQATALDPNYADAWAASARALFYRARDFPNSAADPTVDPEVLPDVRRALALNPNLAEAHLVLGLVPSPPQQRRAELMKAIALDPSNAESWFALSRMDQFEGKYAQEYDDLKKAQQLDPLWHRAAVGASDAASDGDFKQSDAYSIRAQIGLGNHSLEGGLAISDRARRAGRLFGSRCGGRTGRI